MCVRVSVRSRQYAPPYSAYNDRSVTASSDKIEKINLREVFFSGGRIISPRLPEKNTSPKFIFSILSLRFRIIAPFMHSWDLVGTWETANGRLRPAAAGPWRERAAAAGGASTLRLAARRHPGASGAASIRHEDWCEVSEHVRYGQYEYG